MKKLLLLSVILIFTFSSECYSQTMGEMIEDAQTQYETADTKLNIAYNQLKKKHNDQIDFLEKLKLAQRLWIKYRDASISMRFPSSDPRSSYGSMYPLCVLNYKTTLTNNRTKELLDFKTGCWSPEGLYEQDIMENPPEAIEEKMYVREN